MLFKLPIFYVYCWICMGEAMKEKMIEIVFWVGGTLGMAAWLYFLAQVVQKVMI
jgi:hypothetical protein